MAHLAHAGKLVKKTHAALDPHFRSFLSTPHNSQAPAQQPPRQPAMNSPLLSLPQDLQLKIVSRVDSYAAR